MYKHWNDWYKIEPSYCPKLKTNCWYCVDTKNKKYINNDGGIRGRQLPILLLPAMVGAVVRFVIIAVVVVGALVVAVTVNLLYQPQDRVVVVVVVSVVLDVDRDWMERKKNSPLGMPNWKISIIKSKMNVKEDEES
jgi:hypothetical protein